MRIAIPVLKDNSVAPALGSCAAFKFYEDDHGKIQRQFIADFDASGTAGAIRLLERYGIDALICGNPSAEERLSVGGAGIMLFPGAGGDADAAALQFLSGTIAFDPANSCNACGHGHTCSMDCEACHP